MQETFLRAWRSRETFSGRSTFRAWRYRIATNAALDIIGRRPSGPVGHGRRQPRVRGAVAGAVHGGTCWLPPRPGSPRPSALSRETIELAFIVAVQQLPPQGRAALLLRDVLGWSAVDSAELLDVSVRL